MIGYVTSPPEKRLRIAMFTRRPDGSQPDIECVESVNRIAADLRRLGHRVSHIDNPASGQFGQRFLLYWSMLAASLRLAGLPAVQRYNKNRNSLQLQAFDPRLLEPMTRQLGRHFATGFWRVPATLRQLRQAAESYRRLFTQHDAVLCPTLGTTVPSVGHLAPNLDFRELEPRLSAFASFTPLDNVAGTPAVSLPVGFDDKGLPLGVQLSGDRGAEATLLALGLELEQAGLLTTRVRPHAILS
jgi:amidase